MSIFSMIPALKYTHVHKHILWRQSKSIGRNDYIKKACFQYLLMHTLLNRTHPKDTTEMQNISNKILLLTEADLASGQKKKMPSPNRCLLM